MTIFIRDIDSGTAGKAVVERFAVLCSLDTEKVSILRDPNSAGEIG